MSDELACLRRHRKRMAQLKTDDEHQKRGRQQNRPNDPLCIPRRGHTIESDQKDKKRIP